MDDLILVKQIDPSICDELLSLFDESSPFWHTTRKKTEDGVPIKFSTDLGMDWIYSLRQFPFLNKLGDELFKALTEYNEKYPDAKLDTDGVGFVNNEWIIQKYDPGQGYYRWHSEWSSDGALLFRVLVWTLYLNDVPNGGTEFKYLNKATEAKKGNLVLFPASWSHTHRGQIVNTEKYIATGWCSSDYLND